MCMYAIGTELQLVPGSSPEVVKELTTNKPADLGCLAQRNESLQTQKSAAALAFSFGIAFLPPRSGISIIQQLTIIEGEDRKELQTNFSQHENEERILCKTEWLLLRTSNYVIRLFYFKMSCFSLINPCTADLDPIHTYLIM